MLKFADFIKESFTVGQDIYVSTKDGRVMATIKNIKGKNVYWSNEKGQMGMSNIEDIIFLDKKNLKDIYFKSSPKLTKFLIPFDVFKETEKAYLLGYKEGKIWVPKKSVYQIVPNYFADIPNIPKNGYWLSYMSYFDDDKLDFFENYAHYIHQQKKLDSEEKYKKYKEKNDKLFSDLKKVVKYLYNLISEQPPELDWINFEKYEIQTLDSVNIIFNCWMGDIEQIYATIDNIKFDLKPENVKNNTLERRKFLTLLAKKLKNSNYKKLLFELEKEYHNTEIKKDDTYMYSDDSRAYKTAIQEIEKIKNLKHFLDNIKN